MIISGEEKDGATFYALLVRLFICFDCHNIISTLYLSTVGKKQSFLPFRVYLRCTWYVWFIQQEGNQSNFKENLILNSQKDAMSPAKPDALIVFWQVKLSIEGSLPAHSSLIFFLSLTLGWLNDGSPVSTTIKNVPLKSRRITSVSCSIFRLGHEQGLDNSRGVCARACVVTWRRLNWES